MRRIVLLVVCVFLLTSLASFHPAQAAAFPIDYSDPASDVVRLNSTTNECVLDPAGACIKSPNPADVNIGSIHGRDGGTYLNFSIQVKGRIRDYANTSYTVNFYGDASNQTRWVVNYTNGVLHLYTNHTETSPTDISGNSTIYGPNLGAPDTISMHVDKSLLGGPSNISASVNIDATAIMRGQRSLGQNYSFEDFGWEVPGHPASSPTLLKGHVYARGSTSGLAGATVAIGGQSVATNATGYYEVALSPGTYTVNVSASGYVTATGQVTLTVGQTVTKDFELDRTLAGTLQSDALWIGLAVLALFVIIFLVLLARRKRKKGVQVPLKPTS